MKELADVLVMDPTTLRRLLDPLVRRGLVEVRAETGDARARQVFVSQEGDARFAAAIPHWRRARATVNEIIGTKEVAALTEQLALTISQLGEQS